MKKKDERQRLDKQWKKIQRHFTRFSKTEDPEELHRFRVEVKKIRSLLTLLESNKKNEGLLKHFKPVKKIFKSAGRVRDSLLHVQQAKEHNLNLPEFYSEQDAAQKRETKKLMHKKEKHLAKIKEVRKKLGKHLHPLSDYEVKNFFTRKINNTERLLSRRDFTERLHNGRKMLKHVLYNRKMLAKDLDTKLNIDFRFVDELQDVIGQWHDNKLTLRFFDKKLSDTELASLKTKDEELQRTIIDKGSHFRTMIQNKR